MLLCNAAGLVLNMPGSDDQDWHMDGDHLWVDRNTGQCYCAVPHDALNTSQRYCAVPYDDFFFDCSLPVDDRSSLGQTLVCVGCLLFQLQVQCVAALPLLV